MEYLAMCDSSITSRVCCVAVYQNSLCSIVLGVILKCHFSGCSCCYKCLPLSWRQRGASRTHPNSLSASRWKQSPPHSGSQKFAAWFFFPLCHHGSNSAGSQGGWQGAACGHITSASFPSREDPCCDTLPQLSWVAPYGGPLNCNLCSSCSSIQNAWSKLRPCSSPFWVAFEWQYRGTLLCAWNCENLCGGERPPFLLEARLGRMVA